MSRMCWWLGFFVLLLLSVSEVSGQDINYINYDSREGLAASNVYHATQDKDGFMWFATENGLNRFDGKNFKTFTVKDGLPDNEIIDLFVDSKNRVWLLPFKAAIGYYYKGKFFNYENDSLLRQLKFKGNPFTMAEDKDGNLLITEFTQYHLIRKNGQVESAVTGKGKWETLGPVGVNSRGELQIFVVMSVVGMPGVFDPVSGQIVDLNSVNEHGAMNNAIVHPRCTVFNVQNDSLAVNSTVGGSFKVHYSYGNIDYLDNDQLAITRDKGVDLYDLRSRALVGHLLHDFKINSSFLDREGNYWFTTKGSGIIMVPSLSFRNFSSIGAFPLSINSLATQKSILLIGSENAQLWQFNPANKKFLNLNETLRYKVTDRITAILPVSDQKIVVGSDNGLSANFALHTDHTGITLQKALLFSVKSIARAGDTTLITSHHVTSILDLKRDTIIKLREGRAACALKHDSGYYIGTLNGLFFMDQSARQTYLGDRDSNLKEKIIALAASSDGTLWIATKGHGLIGYYNGKVIHLLSEKSDITSDNCTALYIINDSIWLGTDKGLNLISNTSTGKYSIDKYTVADGLHSNTVNAIVQIGNTVYVGSSKGLTYFTPGERRTHSKCNIALTGIYLNGKYWTSDTTGFILPHGSNDIRFEYAGISLKSGNDMNFLYRLQGLSNEFRSTKENSISFPSLPSGKYTLEIKAVNGNGVESTMKVIRFEISKSFFEKTWVWLIGIAIVIALSVLFFRYRVEKIKQREMEKTSVNKRIAELEQVALRSQMNPHFIFNSLNSIQQYVIEKDVVGANSFITDFSNLIRMTLDFSTRKEITLAEELVYIDTYLKLEKSRLENQFKYVIQLDPHINPDIYTLPPLLVQPFVENSIRHGVKNLVDKKGQITISISRKEEAIQISVIDNGVGRAAARLYKTSFDVHYQSKGILLSEKRIESYSIETGKKASIEIEDIKLASEESGGTRVNIYMPVDK
jgi:ligand-binding sensor domain-containing protein